MFASAVFCFVCSTLIHSIDGVPCYDWGDEVTACSRMKPKIYDEMTEIADKEYFRVVPNSNTFYPGGTLYIRVYGKSQFYNGVIMSVVHTSGDGKTQGVWRESHQTKYRTFGCDGMPNSGIAEANDTKHVMPIEADVLVWEAPASCDFDKPFYDLMATVVKSHTEILTGLSVGLECVPRPTTELDLSCGSAFAQDYTLMTSMNTSFETDFGGWWNDPSAALRWTRHKGSTPSPKTGPSAAHDGEYYVFAEASFPAENGEVAILNSPPGLRGCFCIRLKCHMWSGPGVYFEIRVNGKETWRHTSSEDAWISGWQTVSDSDYPQVQFIMHRGIDFRDDIAVDTITITPGICWEDMKSENN
uniref:uncharacterized protein LOC120338392 isoform X1 n=1 Tax=Styela clava TaxID=7725 RepID=UPI001939C9EB|nr:uncharacterized protein LOC120338392 isoform X1 [Styela clava]